MLLRVFKTRKENGNERINEKNRMNENEEERTVGRERERERDSESERKRAGDRLTAHCINCAKYNDFNA